VSRSAHVWPRSSTHGCARRTRVTKVKTNILHLRMNNMFCDSVCLPCVVLWKKRSHAVCCPPFWLSNHLTDFHKIWYDRYSIVSHHSYEIYNVLEPVITTAQWCKLVRDTSAT
jgi:hypothetical protein